VLINNDLVLDTIEEGDIDQLRAARNGEWADSIFQYKFISMNKQREWFGGLSSKSDQFWFAVRWKSSSGLKLVGVTELLDVCPIYHRASLGINIFGDYQRRGFAYRALVMLLKYGFEELNLHKIFLEVIKTNAAAINLYRKLNFIEDGVLRDQYFTRGEYVNVVVMSMLRNEYFSKNRDLYAEICKDSGWPTDIEFGTVLWEVCSDE